MDRFSRTLTHLSKSEERNVCETIIGSAFNSCSNMCHPFSDAASAMCDGKYCNVAPVDLWSGSMMTNSAVAPYWKAAVSAEVAATPSQKSHIEEDCSRFHSPMAAPINPSPNGEVLAFLRDDHAKWVLVAIALSRQKLDFFLRRGTNYLQSFVSGGVLYRASARSQYCFYASCRSISAAWRDYANGRYPAWRNHQKHSLLDARFWARSTNGPRSLSPS